MENKIFPSEILIFVTLVSDIKQDMPCIAQCTQTLIHPINFRILLICLNLNVCPSIVLNWDSGALLIKLNRFHGRFT